MESADYPYIVAWGKMMRSDQAYIREQVRKATAAGAPADATHEDSQGGWSTTGDIVANRTRVALGLDPLPPTAPVILGLYGAHVISMDRAEGLDNYLYRLRFPSLTSAATWASTYKIAGEVSLVGGTLAGVTLGSFDQPVTVEYLRED